MSAEIFVDVGQKDKVNAVKAKMLVDSLPQFSFRAQRWLSAVNGDIKIGSRRVVSPSSRTEQDDAFGMEFAQDDPRNVTKNLLLSKREIHNRVLSSESATFIWQP